MDFTDPTTGQNIALGIMKSPSGNSYPKNNFCQNSSHTQTQGFDPVCLQYLNIEAFTDFIINNCIGQNECNITDPMDNYLLPSADADYQNCNNDRAMFFVQLGCSFPKETMNQR